MTKYREIIRLPGLFAANTAAYCETARAAAIAITTAFFFMIVHLSFPFLINLFYSSTL